MNDLPDKLGEALGHVDVDWTPERADRTWRGLRVRRRRRAVARTIGAAACAAAVAMAAYRLAPSRRAPEPVARRAEPAPPPVVTPLAPEPSPTVESLATLGDGTVVQAGSDGAAVEVVRDAGDRAEVRVVAGKAVFHAPRRPQRPLQVVSGDVRIAVYAAEFSVARYDGATEVWAGDGVLEVEWRGQRTQVRAGDTARFPPPDAVDAPPARAAAPPRERSPRERVADLLREADRARAGRRSRAAVDPLAAVVRDYPRDPRAPLAAFTLGRVWLDELGDPREAAHAFARARALAPDGPLAEDALAREAEAWARAGEAARARDRARDYLRRYPNGHRVREMRRIAGE
ncbi:MAG: hypothetical protein D6689_04690 [Deltaproteobacteria bacterium]|nr:MAG: hypothetical protein D6689_04690 [Deltaproteobacteria bacterium]